MSRVLISLVIGLATTFAMLVTNWEVVPPINHVLVEPYSTAGLIVDVVLCFFVAFTLMFAALHRRHPDGLIIAAVMAVCGWGVYYSELASAGGLAHSQFPRWYDLLTFFKYPLAFVLALGVFRIST